MRRFTFKAPIEIRATGLSKEPEYIIKAYLNANIPDNYGTLQMQDGSKKALKSIFTKNGMESLRRQAKSKKIMVDLQHKTAAKINVEHFLDQAKVDPKIKEGIMRQVAVAELPLFKLNDIYEDPINPDRTIVDARMNPHYRLVDEAHKNQFDAVWKSMKEGFINQVSFDFATTDVQEVDGIDRINDLDLFGIDFLGGGALPENQIYEVAMRATQEFKEGETQMKENEKLKEDLKVKEAELNVIKDEQTKAQEEVKKQEIITKEKAEQTERTEVMQKEINELKKKNEETDKLGVVPPENKPDSPNLNADDEAAKYGEHAHKVFQDKFKTTKQFPNHEDMWKGAPRKVNMDGELGLGEALVLHREYYDKTMEAIPEQERNKILTGLGAVEMQHIPARKYR